MCVCVHVCVCVCCVCVHACLCVCKAKDLEREQTPVSDLPSKSLKAWENKVEVFPLDDSPYWRTAGITFSFQT